MLKLTRRAAVGAFATLSLARPGIIQAQTSSAPIRIGLLSDVGGPYRDVGGPDSKLAMEMAVEVKPRVRGGNSWDVFKLVSTVPSPDAFAPPGLFGCPFVRA